MAKQMALQMVLQMALADAELQMARKKYMEERKWKNVGKKKNR